MPLPTEPHRPSWPECKAPSAAEIGLAVAFNVSLIVCGALVGASIAFWLAEKFQ